MAFSAVSGVEVVVTEGAVYVRCSQSPVFSPQPNSSECQSIWASDLVLDGYGSYGNITNLAPYFDSKHWGQLFVGTEADSLGVPTGFASGSGGSSSGTTTVEFGPPFNLSVEDGILVGGAVVGVWLIGFAFRALRGALRDHDYPGGD